MGSRISHRRSRRLSVTPVTTHETTQRRSSDATSAAQAKPEKPVISNASSDSGVLKVSSTPGYSSGRLTRLQCDQRISRSH